MCDSHNSEFNAHTQSSKVENGNNTNVSEEGGEIQDDEEDEEGEI